jgi:predicted TIM-barrel fold metal-dependent hydrolase
MEIMDVHVHCYPAEVVENPIGWADAHGERHWGSLVTQGPQGWADPEGLLRAMDRDGISKVLLQAWYWENPETARRQNEWHARWLERYPDRFMACAAIHPAMENPLGELESARKWGACAVGECLPVVQDKRGWSHPAWEHILAWTTRQQWPLCVHLTEPVGHSYPGRIETPLHEAIDLFERHPGQKWICAHWGGGLPFYSLNRRVQKCLDNVWFDTAASPLLYDRKIWKTVCDLVGPDKILFGSDFPLLLYPRRHKTPGWAPLLEEFHTSGLPADARRKIAAGNYRAPLPERG